MSRCGLRVLILSPSILIYTTERADIVSIVSQKSFPLLVKFCCVQNEGFSNGEGVNVTFISNDSSLVVKNHNGVPVINGYNIYKLIDVYS